MGQSGTGVPDAIAPLARLEATASRLNSASDQLNAALETLQRRLNAASVGVEVWTSIDSTRSWPPLDISSDPDDYTEYQLGYGKLGEQWALKTRFAEFSSGDGGAIVNYGDEKPLLRSPREVRLQAIGAIPSLVASLEQRAAELLDLVERAEAIAYSGAAPGAQDPFRVPCHASDCFLEFGEWSAPVDTGEYITVEVKSGSRDSVAKVADLVVMRHELLRAVHAVQPYPAGDEHPPDVNELEPFSGDE